MWGFSDIGRFMCGFSEIGRFMCGGLVVQEALGGEA